ncbi:hypothetical protein BKA62DRAFT_657636 [Auriculariales sp. MPI-PUGE-AT-0066]|nr:hypothetical protein BKA62DRAFT_657636 [Auriculariales sp. MPI-PUGE-AT-0066]
MSAHSDSIRRAALRAATAAMPTKSLSQAAPADPEQLRELVLDYLEHNCHGATLVALRTEMLRRGEITERGKGKQRATETDSLAEGGVLLAATDVAMNDCEDDSPSDALYLKFRTEIRRLILQGSVSEATSLLNAQLPRVLDPNRPAVRPPGWLSSVQPLHVSLNLDIQAFVELLRTPASPDVAMDLDRLRLAAGRRLHARIAAAASPPHTREWTLVGSLMAYKYAPRDAPTDVRGYFTQARRVALAAQVDAAILCALGRSPVARLEMAARRTAAVWQTGRDLGLQLPRAASKEQGSWMSAEQGGDAKRPRNVLLLDGIQAPHLVVPLKDSSGADIYEPADDLVPLFDLHEYVQILRQRAKAARARPDTPHEVLAVAS